MRNEKQVCQLTIMGSLIGWGNWLTAMCWFSHLRHVNSLPHGTQTGLFHSCLCVYWLTFLALRNPETTGDFYWEWETDVVPIRNHFSHWFAFVWFLNCVCTLHEVIWHYYYFHMHYNDMCMYKCKKKNCLTFSRHLPPPPHCDWLLAGKTLCSYFHPPRPQKDLQGEFDLSSD